MDPAALLREQLDALNGGISHAMVTIVEADGSTPKTEKCWYLKTGIPLAP